MKVKHTTKRPFFIRWWMETHGYKGLTTPWNTIYYENDAYMNDEHLRKHEEAHIMQMERDGKLKYLVKYNWYWLTKGYKNNPYEIEARRIARQ